MSSENCYEKHYLTIRRPVNEESEKYVLVLFRSDDSFIIKKKSNLHGVNADGLVTIRDGSKTYKGYCYREGTLAQIEKTARRLDEDFNTDVESDCEVIIDSSLANNRKPKQSAKSTKPSESIQSEQSSLSTAKSTDSRKKTDIAQPKIQSLASLNINTKPTNYKTPSSANTSLQKNRTQASTIEQNSKNGCHASSATSNSTKNVSRRMKTFDDDDDDDDDYSIDEGVNDDDDDDDVRADQLFQTVTDLNDVSPSTSTDNYQHNDRSTKRKPSKTLSLGKPGKRICADSLNQENHQNKEELPYLKALATMIDDLSKDVYQISKASKDLVVSVEKIDKKLNVLYENQKKIQRALTKRKINIDLNGGEFGDENILPDDEPFKSSLVYTNPDGESVDLLQLYGVHTRIGRYVALVMDNIFTKEELSTISLKDLINNDRYLLIKEAVRCRFKLNRTMMKNEWETVYESILQKRRNEIKNMKKNIAN